MTDAINSAAVFLTKSAVFTQNQGRSLIVLFASALHSVGSTIYRAGRIATNNSIARMPEIKINAANLQFEVKTLA